MTTPLLREQSASWRLDCPVMPRISRQMAFDLISFVKRIDVSLNVHHPTATSALEFFRQMDSKRLKKKNPEYQCAVSLHGDDVDSKVKVQFSDGSTWETSTKDYQCSELRGEMYLKAQEIEEAMERAEADDVSGGYGEEDFGEKGRVIKHHLPLEGSIEGMDDDDVEEKQTKKATPAPAKKK